MKFPASNNYFPAKLYIYFLIHVKLYPAAASINFKLVEICHIILFNLWPNIFK